MKKFLKDIRKYFFPFFMLVFIPVMLAIEYKWYVSVIYILTSLCYASHIIKTDKNGEEDAE